MQFSLQIHSHNPLKKLLVLNYYFVDPGDSDDFVDVDDEDDDDSE